MKNLFRNRTVSRGIVSKIFVLFLLVSVIVPETIALPTLALAQEIDADSAVSDPAPQTPSHPSSTNSPSFSSSKSSSGGSSSDAGGSITVCKMIVDNNQHIMTGNTGLPTGAFRIDLSLFTSTSTVVESAQFDTQSFDPNEKLILDRNDAECITYNNLTIGGEGYFYAEENVQGPSNTWKTPKYNDQFDVHVSTLNDFFPYTLGNEDNENADGHIILTPERPNRTLVILNTFQGQTGPSCAFPNTLGDTQVEEFGTNGSGEQTLEDILSTSGYPLDVIQDQKQYQTWNSATNTAVTIEAKFLAKYGATRGTVFGYYINSDLNTFHPLFQSGAHPLYPNVPNFSVGQTVSFTTDPALRIGFAMVGSPTAPQFEGMYPMWATQNALNNGWTATTTIRNDRAVAYNIPAVPGGYVIAFEDSLLQNPDFDYNDMVVALKVTNCSTTQPQPGNQPPVITLLGKNPMDVLQGNHYIEPGYEAHDPEELDITDRVVVTGGVNSNVLGQYDRTYYVEDTLGLSDTKVRHINVVPAGTGPACGSPNSLGDTVVEEIGPNPNELTLQRIMALAGYSASSTADQKQYQTWNNAIPNQSITIETEFIGKYGATAGTVFGYYTDNDLNTFKPLFQSGHHPDQKYANVEEFTPGQTTSFTVNATRIGFAMVGAPTAFPGQYPMWATQNALNNGWTATTTPRNDRAVVYDMPNHRYVVAFEDSIRPDPDFDYNDMVVSFRVTNCNGQPVNTPPVLTLNGDNPMNITIGTPFIDPWATAFDLEDGEEINQHIMATGTVDVNTLGTYTIHYSVTDTGGLMDSKDRIVNVVEAGQPQPPGGGGGGGGGGGRRRGQVLGEETGPSGCVYLYDWLKKGWDNDRFEVIKLQLFLKYMEGFSTLQATGVYDDATFDAVSTFQNRYFDDILKPWGHTAPTGFTYILTKKKVNEIVCDAAFPVTPQEAQEIETFHAFIESLRVTGTLSVAGSIGNTMGNSTNGNSSLDSSSETNEDIKDISPSIKDIFGDTASSSASTMGHSDKNNPINTGDFRSVAAAIFSVPDDRSDWLTNFYFLLIALIAIYLLTEIIVGSLDATKLTKYQIWTRKAIVWIIGLALAILIAGWYGVWNIILPLALLIVVAVGFLIWVQVKKPKVPMVISEPKK